MGPCVVRIFQYISNKVQCHTVYFIWKLLYVFRVVSPPIIRSAYKSIYSIWYLSHRYCYLPLSWRIWSFHPSSGAHTTVSGIRHTVTAICRYRGGFATSTHYQERIQQYLVFVTPLLLSAVIVEDLEPPPIIKSAYNSIWYLSHRYCYLPLSWRIWNCSSNSPTVTADSSNGVTNTRCCRYCCMRS